MTPKHAGTHLDICNTLGALQVGRITRRYYSTGTPHTNLTHRFWRDGQSTGEKEYHWHP